MRVKRRLLPLTFASLLVGCAGVAAPPTPRRTSASKPFTG
jgi:hypothetical protein